MGGTTGALLAGHPRVFAARTQRDALWNKIQTTAWAKSIYDGILNQVTPLVTMHASDPQHLVSRLQMHWEAGRRYTTFEAGNNVVAMRSGSAPYPTVRVSYGRTGTGSRPGLDRLQPYGNGDLQLNQSGTWNLVPFAGTGLGAEDVNMDILAHAYRAAIVYYFTGDKRYAKLAADVIWTFARGASYQEQLNPTMATNSFGYLAYETLGDTRRFATLPLTFDFIYDYLTGEYFQSAEFLRGRPGEIWCPGHPEGGSWAMERIGVMFQKFIDNKLTRGGGLEGNWNTNEHQSAMLYALAMDDDQSFGNRKGRNFYVDKLLNGPTTPGHGAYLDVAAANLDPLTGLWPEAPAGYGQGSIEQLVRFGYWYWRNGIDVLAGQPALRKAAISFPLISFPNGYATGWGDGQYATVFTEQAELMISYARAKGDADLERTFTSLLAFAGARNPNRGEYYAPLFFYVPSLAPATPLVAPRTSYAPDHALIFQRNLAPSPKDALAYSVYGYGANSSHRHQNGLSMELYGRGHVMGVDPGAGPDYWDVQHVRYNRAVAAHNTVIPNGVACDDAHPMDLEILHAEPDVRAGQAPARELSALYQFTDTRGRYQAGTALQAEQRRVMGIVRTSATAGYYVDIFRSRVASPTDTYHDYVYHNMGTSLSLAGVAGAPLSMSGPNLAANSGFGYEYFQGAGSAPVTTDFSGTFDFGQAGIQMKAWLLGNAGRTAFSLTGPANFRYYVSPLRTVRVPTLLVRQTGEAWLRPFVAVYEPSGDGTQPSVTAVRRLAGAPAVGDFVGLSVQRGAESDRICNDTTVATARTYEGIECKAIFGVVSSDAEGVQRMYLGTGMTLVAGEHGIYSGGAPIGLPAAEELVRASLVRDVAGASYTYSADKAVTIRFPYRSTSPGLYRDLRVHYDAGAGPVPALATVALPLAGSTQIGGTGILLARVPAAIAARLSVVNGP